MDQRFLAGRSAVAWLGLRLELDAKTRGYFERYRRETQEAGASTQSLDEAITQLRQGLLAAWEICGRQSELAGRVGRPADMGFVGLSRLFLG